MDVAQELTLAQVLNIVAFVSDRTKPKDQRKWDGPWLKKVTMDTIQSDFAGWDEYPRSLLSVRARYDPVTSRLANRLRS